MLSNILRKTFALSSKNKSTFSKNKQKLKMEIKNVSNR